MWAGGSVPGLPGLADVAVPVLPDLPEGLHWLLTERSAGHYGFTGDTKDLLPGPDAPAADRIAAVDALILPGTHFLASDGSVRVEIPEPVAALARFRATGGALLQRANAGDWSVAPDWTELSGGEAQRVKLVSELQRSSHGDALYVLDEPTGGLHPADSDRLMRHLQGLADAGNTVIMAELDMRMVAQADHGIDMGPGAGRDGGRVVCSGTPP